MTITQSPRTAPANQASVTNPPTKPRLPYPLRVALTMAVMLVPLVSLMLFAGLFQLLVPGVRNWPAGARDATALVFTLGCALVGIGLVWLLIRFVDRRKLRNAGLVLTSKTIPLFLLGTAAGAAVLFTANWITDSLGLLNFPGETIVKTPLGFLAAMAMGFLAQGFPEEFLFRGYLLQTMRNRPGVAVIVSAVAFGTMHWVSQGAQQEHLGWRLLYMGAAGSMGLLAGVLAVRCQSMWVAVGVHGGMHLGFYLSGMAGLASGPAFAVAEIIGYLTVAGIVYLTKREAFARPIELVN